MGIKSRRKKFARQKRLSEESNKIKWTRVGYWIIFPSLGLAICSILLYVKTFLQYSVILEVVLLGGVISSIILRYLWRKENFPLWSILTYGLLSGGALLSFSLLAPNYFFRNQSTIKYQAEIVDTGNRSSRSSSCKTPYAVVLFNDMKKEIAFPCDYDYTIRQYKKVELEVSKGLWGFPIIENKRLIK